MKNLLSIIASILLSIQSTTPRFTQQEYIEIRHTGIQQKPFKQSFIIKNKLDFKTIEEHFKEIKLQVKSMTQKEQENLWNMMYDTIVTDNKTFSEINSFIDKHQMFYTYDTKSDRSEYSIIVNGKTHRIVYKLQKRFFYDLIIHLEKENCDNIVIKDIKSY